MFMGIDKRLPGAMRAMEKPIRVAVHENWDFLIRRHGLAVDLKTGDALYE